jgi:hypothetical protein
VAKKVIKPKLSTKARRLVNTLADRHTVFGEAEACSSDSGEVREKGHDCDKAREKLSEYIITLEQEVLMLRAARNKPTYETNSPRDSPPAPG